MTPRMNGKRQRVDRADEHAGALDERGEPDYRALAAKGRELVDVGMRAVVYCGSMGDLATAFRRTM